MAGLPLLIYANKQDLISALPAEEIEEELSLGMINDRAWTIVACSAKDKEGKSLNRRFCPEYDFNLTCNIGLKEGIDWLI